MTTEYNQESSKGIHGCPKGVSGMIEANDPVTKPSHYQGRYGMEALDVMKNFALSPAYIQGHYWCNAIKYLLRWHKKNGLEDLKKARENLDYLIASMEEVEDDTGN